MAYLSKTADFVRATVAATCLLFVGQAGCSSSTVDEDVRLSVLGQHCLINSDCNDPLVCAFEACHAECVKSRDCDGGARCVAAARPYKVCLLDEERRCERKSDCPDGLDCGVDGECRDTCATANDCVEDQLCVSGTCADADELDENGQLTPKPGASSGSEGSPCVYVSDCSAALLCRNQACLPECKADKDCGLHQICQETRCLADGSQPKACNYTSDCEKAGERCLAGGCLCSCVEDRDCPLGESCNDCGCEPAPDARTPCSYNSDCLVAGEICRENVCDCQCKTDVDCAAGSRCDDCGCVEVVDPIDGVVFGDVKIDSNLELELYRGVREIRGNLYLESDAITDLGDTFDDLTRIEGFFIVQAYVPLEEIAFPSLDHAGVIRIKKVAALAALRFPKLKDATVELTDLQALDELVLSELATGSFSAALLPLLETLELPKAQNLYTFALGGLPLLEALDLPALTTIQWSFSIAGIEQPMLSALSAPQLQTFGLSAGLGSIFIDNTKLTTLSAFAKQAFTILGSDVEITNNALLGSCEVDAFATRCTDAAFSGTVKRDGSCAACQSADCSVAP